MPKWMQYVLAGLVVVLLVVAAVLWVRVQRIDDRCDITYAGVDSLTAWAAREAPKVRARFDLVKTRLDSLAVLARIGKLPPWGGVPADPCCGFPP